VNSEANPSEKNQTHDLEYEIEINPTQKNIGQKIYLKDKCFKKYQSWLELIFQIYNSGHEIRVTSLKVKLKNKEARFLTKQILRDEIEGKKSIKKTMQNKINSN